jgi:surface antigen
MNKSIIIGSSVIIILLLIIPAITLASITDLNLISNPTSGPNQNIFLYTGPNIAGNNYAFGNCTWWVAYLKIQEGRPIPNSWGNALTWATRAMNDGYEVDQNPTTGSIMQDPNAPGGEGHVALVESIDLYGNWTISEMNRVGFDEVDTRTIPASVTKSYFFIHDRGL